MIDANEREYEMMKDRVYGMTLKKMGEKYSLSPERCRQILIKAVARFRYLRRRHKITEGFEPRFVKIFDKDEVINIQDDPFLESNPADVLDLGVSWKNAFYNENISTMRDLISMTETDILRIPNIGRKKLNELKDELNRINLHLGFSVFAQSVEGNKRCYIMK